MFELMQGGDFSEFGVWRVGFSCLGMVLNSDWFDNLILDSD